MVKKSILVYTESYLPAIGGLENNTELLCNTLVKLGHLVTLITPQKNAKTSNNFIVIESGGSFKVYLETAQRSQLIIINGGVSFKMALPAIISGKPYLIIYQMATLYHDIRQNDLKTKIFNYLRKLIASNARANIAVSEYSYSDLVNVFGSSKTKLLINPADPIFKFSKNASSDLNLIPFKCLIAGRLIEGKGVSLLMEAVNEINKEAKVVELYVIGDGPEKKKVIEQQNLGNVIYQEPVSKTIFKSWLETVHLVIIPSTSHVEGSPLVMAESLVMGVPVLVSSQAAMMASVKNEHLIFRINDKADLIYKINQLRLTENYRLAKKHCEEISNLYQYHNYCEQLKSAIDV